MLCNENELCSDCNKTEYHKLEILQPIYSLSVILGNDQCSEAVLLFFCNAANNNISALMRECKTLRDDECAAEWRITENLLKIELPSCSSFEDGVNFTTARAPILSCPDDFEVFCGSLCLPLCDEVSIFNDVTTIVYEVLDIILHSLSLIGGVVVFFACCLRKRKM